MTRAAATALFAVAVAAAVTACSGQAAPAPTVTVTATSSPEASSTTAVTAPESTTSSSSSTPTQATAVAAQIQARVSTVTQVVTITEDNDPNGKIGRPGGYTSAAVLYDSGTACEQGQLGASCGATIEVWPTAADAAARSQYIQSALKANPMLGTEYDYLSGDVLLRVTGVLKPSVAARYEAAFKG